MPAAIEESLSVPACKGLNTADLSHRIDDLQATELINFELNPTGELTKRPGINYASGPIDGSPNHRLLGYFVINNVGFFLATTSNTGDLYRSLNGVNWTLIGTAVGSVDFMHAVLYANSVYMVNPNGIWRWDGTTLTFVVGSPPGTFITVFRDRLFVFSSFNIVTTSRLYFSAAGVPTSWPGTNFIDVNTGDGDFLTAAYPLGDKLLLFKTNSVWSLYVQGSPINWILRLTRKDIGCVAMLSLSEIDGELYFLDSKAVYKTNGAEFTSVSEPIRNLIHTYAKARNYDMAQAVRLGDRYILSFQTLSKILVFYPKVGGWTTWEPKQQLNIRDFAVAISSTFNRIYFLASTFGVSGQFFYINNPLILKDPLTDNLFPYRTKYTSKLFEFSLDSKFKRGKLLNFFVDITFPLITHTLAIIYTTENGSETHIFEDIEAGRQPYKLKGPGFFRRFQITFEEDQASKFDFFGFELKMSQKRDYINIGQGN